MTEAGGSIRAQLCEAVYAQKLEETAQALASRTDTLNADDSTLLAAAQQVCGRIRAQLIADGTELASRLREASIPCVFEASAPELTAPQYHQFSLSVDVEDPTRAVELLQSVGFWSPLSTRDMYWESFRRAHGEMTLTRLDDASTRLQLRWRAGPSTAAWQPGLGTLLRNPARVARSVYQRLCRLTRRQAEADTIFFGDLLSTPRSLLPQLLHFVGVSREDIVVDIGCGDGRVLIEAARRTGCRGIGLEAQRELCMVARKRVNDAGVKDLVEIRQENTRKAPLADATVVFLFVPVRALSEYVPRLLPSLAAGARVVAHEQVALEAALKPDRSEPLIGEHAITVAHLWRVG